MDRVTLLWPYLPKLCEVNPLLIKMSGDQGQIVKSKVFYEFGRKKPILRLALGDIFGLFIQTLNNAEKLFIQIIHSIEKKNYRPPSNGR